MQRQQRQATLRRQGGGVPQRTNTPSSTVQVPHPRRCPEKQMQVISAPSSRFARWPKNVFFASDFIAHKAAASTKIGHVRRSRSNRSDPPPPRGTVVQRQAHDLHGIGNKAERRRRNNRATGHAKLVPRTRAGHFAEKANVLQAGGRENQEKRRTLGVGGSEGGRFIEESASALLHLHRRFFQAADGEEDLVCRLCVLCREAGWMGNPRDRDAPCSALDPFAVEELLIVRLRNTKRVSAGKEKMGAEHHTSGTNYRSSGKSGILSFEEFYGVLSDIAAVVYPRDMEEQQREGVQPTRAMHRLLAEGVLPLAEDPVPRSWAPRSEILYGRPALAALRTQRDALHQLFHAYSGDFENRRGAKGFRRATFVQMLSDLGVLPTSVSEAHAASIFDAVIRNGLPDTNPADGRTLHDDGTFDVHCVGRRGRGNEGSIADVATVKGWRARRIGEDALKQEDSYLCWSLFLEAMAALAVAAVEDRRGQITTNTLCGNPSKGVTNGLLRERIGAATPCRDNAVQGPTTLMRKARSNRAYESVFPARRSSARTVGEARCGNGGKSGSDVGSKQAKCEVSQERLKVDTFTRTDVRPIAASTPATTGQPNNARGFRHQERKVDVVPTALELEGLEGQRYRAVIRRASSPGNAHGAALRETKGHKESADFNKEEACARQPPSRSRVKQRLALDAECTPTDLSKRHQSTDDCHRQVAVQHSVSRKTGKQEEARPLPVQAVPLLVGRHLARMADQTECKLELGLLAMPFSNRPISERSERARPGEAAEAMPRPHHVCTGPGLEGREIKPNVINSGQDGPAVPKSSANLVFAAGVAMGRGVTSGEPQDPGIWTRELSRACPANGVDVNLELPAPNNRPVDPRARHAQHRSTNKVSNDKLLEVASSLMSTEECDGTEPAPCHGGPPSMNSETCFLVPLAADRIDGVTEVTEAAPVHLGRPSAQAFASMPAACPSERPSGETGAVTTVREAELPARFGTVERSRKNGSEDTKVTRPFLRPSATHKVSVGTSVRPRGRTGRERDFVTEGRVRDIDEKCNATLGASYEETNHARMYVANGAGKYPGDVEGKRMRRSRDYERGGTGDDHNHNQATRKESVTRTMEAVGCTAALFEELLDPKAVSIYARHRKQLTALFRRYRNESGKMVQGLYSSCSLEPSGCVRGSGIRQFVDDFPVLREQWGRDNGTLNLLVRATRGREWRRRCGASTRLKSTASTGLCYPGFLEVLTRMAHAADGHAPLHIKLEALLVALQAEATHRVIWDT